MSAPFISGGTSGSINEGPGSPVGIVANDILLAMVVVVVRDGTYLGVNMSDVVITAKSMRMSVTTLTMSVSVAR